MTAIKHVRSVKAWMLVNSLSGELKDTFQIEIYNSRKWAYTIRGKGQKVVRVLITEVKNDRN